MREREEPFMLPGSRAAGSSSTFASAGRRFVAIGRRATQFTSGRARRRRKDTGAIYLKACGTGRTLHEHATPLPNLALLLSAASKIVALFAALTGHTLLKGSAAERGR